MLGPLGLRRGVALVVAIGLLASALTALGGRDPPAVEQGELLLVVGGQDEMKTRNPLPGIASDRWTQDVFQRVYDTILKIDPETEVPLPYIAKGADADGDGTFEPAERGLFNRSPVDHLGNPCDATAATNFCALNVTVFYDFNGVYFHDGAQSDVWDLLFSYHLLAMNPRRNPDLRVVMDPDFGANRQMFIRPVALDGSDWQTPAPANASALLRASLRFTLREPFAVFAPATLNARLFPQHVWENTGQRGDPPTATPLHPDFGCLVYPAAASGNYVDTTKAGTGIPPGAVDLPAGCASPFAYNLAESWAPQDADVIGSGPFTFDVWAQGQFTELLRNDAYFFGYNPKNPSEVFDPVLPAYLKLPTVEGILFKIYRVTTLGVLALSRGEIDFFHWNIPAEFVPDLLANPNIAVEANAEPGFVYMAYNLRREPFGYPTDAQDQGPGGGYWYRQAVSHLVDKKSIVQNLLQNFGVIGNGVVSPANTFWYNDAIGKPQFDPSLAAAILDAHGWGPDPGGPCSSSTPSGCRSLPVRGTAVFEILTPQADYDPVRAAAGQIISNDMQSVGINVVSTPLAFGEIISRVDARSFDQYISDWRLEGTDPDYLFDLFHSSNAPAGSNHPGYSNATFDQIMETSRRELDRSQRQQAIFDSQLNLAESRPYEPLYYRTNIEGYRKDRWVNWTVSSGTIWNYWSLLGIHPPESPAPILDLKAPSAVASGSATAVTATVFDSMRTPLPGARVDIELLTARGVLSYGASSGLRVNGTTDATGRLVVDYTAPTLLVSDPPVVEMIQATATHPDFPEAAAETIAVTVFPPGEPFLALIVDLPQGDVVLAGDTLPAIVFVTDPNGTPVLDADVTISVYDPLLYAMPSAGMSGALGPLTFIADPSVSQPLDVRVQVQATRAGDASSSLLLSITILPAPPNVPPVPVLSVLPGASGYLDTTFLFDGGNSTDPDGTIVAYTWDFGDGTTATGPAATRTFTAKGPYNVSLAVEDDRGLVRIVTVVIEILDRPPVAEAGDNRTAFKRTLVTLNGSATDPDGDTVVISWMQWSGPVVILSGNVTARPSFTPVLAGIYEFELAVHDGTTEARDSVSITVPERPPVAEAGDNRTAFKRTLVTLNGRATDPDGDSMAFSWTQRSGPVVLLSGNDTARPTFTPVLAGTYEFELMVDDGASEARDSVSITVPERPPTITSATPVGTVTLADGESLRFNATAQEPDGDSLTFRWTVDGKEAGTSPDFTFRGAPGTHIVNLTISDGSLTVWHEWTVVVEPPFPWVAVGIAAVLASLAVLLLAWRRRKKGEAEKKETVPKT